MPTPPHIHWFTDGDDLTVSFDAHTATIYARDEDTDVAVEVPIRSLARFLRVYELDRLHRTLRARRDELSAS